jgi:hypothetical protein
MIWHYNKFVEKICAAVTIVKDGFDKDFSIFRDLEDSATLPTFCSDEV